MSAGPARARENDYPALDGLRCYAALLVFLVHLLGGLLTEYYKVPESAISTSSPVPGIAVLTFLADGHHGVDIFFLISGFLMARITRSGMNWTVFLRRRVSRIYPAFLASLVITTCVYVGMYDWPFLPRDFLLNLVFYNSLPDHGIRAYNHVSWSLGYEFAFYLLVPLLAMWRRASTRAWLALASTCAAFVLLPPSLVRMAGLFAGFALGCVADAHLRRIAARVPWCLVLATYFALVWSKALVPLTFQAFHLVMLPVASLLIVAIVFGANPLTRFFGSGPLRTLGQWSYSIYLFHPVVISLVLYNALDWTGLRAKAAFAVPFLCVASVGLTVLVAATSYALFERPYFRKRSADADAMSKLAADAAPLPGRG